MESAEVLMGKFEVCREICNPADLGGWVSAWLFSCSPDFLLSVNSGQKLIGSY